MLMRQHLLVGLLLLVQACGYEHKICLMTTFRLMASIPLCNLVEWIEYHLLVGVDHFVLRNDCSVDAAAIGEALASYSAAGRLSLDVTPEDECERGRVDSRKIYAQMSTKFAVLHKCHWLSIVDNDEYVSLADSASSGASSKPLLGYLERLLVPFGRMMWFVVGNENFETRPKGTIVGNFQHGAMDKPHYLKTFVKTGITSEFTNAHFPKLLPQYGREFVGLRPSSTDRLYREAYGAVGVGNDSSLLSWRRYIESNAYHRFERHQHNESARSKQRNAPLPPYELFLKHFKYLSWQEYREQRAATPFLANGRVNYWRGNNSRMQWDMGRPSSRHILLGEKFTAHMATALATMLRRRCGAVEFQEKSWKMCCNLWM